MVVAIIAILASVALPAFTDMVRSNRIARASNDFLATLHIARSEAITRNMSVSVCRSNAALTACVAGAGSWADGALVFTDPDSDGTLDTGEEIINSSEPIAGNFEMYSTVFPAAVTFQSNGRTALPTGTDTGQWHICEPDSTVIVRAIMVNRTGRPRVIDGTGVCPT